MRSAFIALAAVAALSACNSANEDAEGAGEASESESEAAEPAATLPNGEPAYPGLDLTAVEDTGVNGDIHLVNFETEATLDEVFDFYRTAYLEGGYEIKSSTINVRDEDAGTNSSFSVGPWQDGTRASMSPGGAQTGFDMSREYGEGFPAYPNAEADSVQDNINGDYRSVSFETSDSVSDVYDFYREALARSFSVDAMSLRAENAETERTITLTILPRYNSDGARVSLAVRDPALEASAGSE